MAKAVTTEIGNLRLLTLSLNGVPMDIEPWWTRCREMAKAADLKVHGGIQCFVDLPPAGDATTEPAKWPCRVGVAVTGFGRPPEGWGIEDYSRLEVLESAHEDSARYLGRTFSDLAGEANRRKWRIRPYWRIRWSHTQTPDGTPLPACLVGVFRDR